MAASTTSATRWRISWPRATRSCGRRARTGSGEPEDRRARQAGAVPASEGFQRHPRRTRAGLRQTMVDFVGPLARTLRAPSRPSSWWRPRHRDRGLGLRPDASVGGIALYFIIWWTLLFAILPFGVRSQAEAGEVAHGHGTRRARLRPPCGRRRSGRRWSPHRRSSRPGCCRSRDCENCRGRLPSVSRTSLRPAAASRRRRTSTAAKKKKQGFRLA